MAQLSSFKSEILFFRVKFYSKDFRKCTDTVILDNEDETYVAF